MDVMDDPFQPVSRPVRWLAIAALGAAVVVLLAIILSLAALPFFGPGFEKEDMPSILGFIAFFGVFLLVCSWLLVRLLRDAWASNGVTTMPLWFIRLIGVLFIGSGALAALKEELLFAVEFVSLGLTMVLISRPGRAHVP